MPPVVLGRDVALAPGVCVGPYAVLGAGCRIGTNAVVRESILWEDVRVAPGVRLYRSILGTGVHVQTPDLHTDVVYRV
jgi:NDP-sugar pyrophosphorylase family protein